jgi:hypothetical protein
MSVLAHEAAQVADRPVRSPCDAGISPAAPRAQAGCLLHILSATELGACAPGFFGPSRDSRIIYSARAAIGASSKGPHCEGVNPVQMSTDRVRRRFLGLLMSGGGFVAWSVVGCGTSENRFEMTEDAKKSVMASKIGDPSKFVKPGKGRIGKR